MIWFTADLHLGHQGILTHSKRPWPTTEEMDAALIANWNTRVDPRDEVWLLGDFCWRGQDVAKYRLQLRGRVHLVLGNHDRRRISLLDANRHFDSVQDVKYLRWEGERFWLSYYAHRTWPKSHHGTYHLFGHSHGDLPPYNRSMDVGVDAVPDYSPITLEYVIAALKDQPITHHHQVR